MDIVIIGSGNVAHCFGHLFRRGGQRIRQVWSRQEMHARELAGELKATWTNHLKDLDRNADLYLMAVSDSAIPLLDDELRLGEKMVAHTAGAVSLGAIQHISTNTGVLYPLQSVRKEMQSGQKMPLLIEGSDALVLKKLKLLAAIISDDVIEMDSARRLKMHLAAVFCNNFTNHLITLCKHYCDRESLDFSLLQPLLRETFGRLENNDPEKVQTGPAIRCDLPTLAMHHHLLEDYPGMQKIYALISQSIKKYYDQEYKNNGN